MNRMKLLREEQHMSMREVANHLGIPYTTYVNYEKGKREPNFETLIAIANFFNSSTDYLLGKSSERIDDDVLDRINSVEMFLLSLTGNIYDAEIIQKMIDDKRPDDAAHYFMEKVNIINNKKETPDKTPHIDFSSNSNFMEWLTSIINDLTPEQACIVVRLVEHLLRLNPDAYAAACEESKNLWKG